MPGPISHIDSPVDYKALWGQLKLRLRAELTRLSQSCATERDADLTRRHQGGYAEVGVVVAIMEELLIKARESERVVVDLDEEPL